MTKQQIINTILNERGYIVHHGGERLAELRDYDGKFLRYVPIATMEKVATMQGVERWKTKYYGEYVAHYLSKEYRVYENEQHCKYIADELDEYAEGCVYKCPECGTTHTIPEDAEKYRCDHCHFVGELDEFEQLSLYDYMENGLDIEYRIGADREYRSAEILIAWGGPNIYIDTAKNAVLLYWGGERAQWSISNATADAIDDVCEEQYDCI